MTLEKQTTASFEEALQQSIELAAQAVQDYGSCTLIVANFERMITAKKALASAGVGLGVAVESANSWLTDLWELHGDGRHMVNLLDRNVYIRKILREHVESEWEDAFPEVTGIVDLLGKLAKFASPEAMRALQHNSGQLSAAELEALTDVKEYLAQLQEAGAIEQSQMVQYLVDHQALSQAAVVVCDAYLSFPLEKLVASTACAYHVVASRADYAGASAQSELAQLSHALYEPDFSRPVQPTGQVKFALPAGIYAQPQVMLDTLLDAADQGSSTFAITAKDPYELFESLAPRLLSHGFNVSVQGTVALDETAFGRAWISLLNFMDHPGQKNAASLTDFALSSFSFMDRGSAEWLDARVRGWRGEELENALTDWSGATAEDHRDFVAAIESGQYDQALSLQLSWIASRMRWSESYRDLQYAVAQFAYEAHRCAAAVGLPLSSVIGIISDCSVDYRAQVEIFDYLAAQGVGLLDGDDAPTVLITSQNTLAMKPRGSFDVVLAADLTAELYPLADDTKALDALLQKIGAWQPAQRIERTRATFAQVVAMPVQELILERPLHTTDSSEERESALFDEVVDCYRADPQNDKELDELYGVAKCLTPYVFTAGEEALALNVSEEGQRPGKTGSYQAEPTGRLIRFAGAPELMLAGSRDAAGQVNAAHLSASALEAYLECPYKWFASRRVNVKTLTAQLGPLEQGNFAHEIMERLHAGLKEAGHSRVTTENLVEATALMNQIYDACLEEQAQSFDPSAFFATDSAELLTVERLRRNLQDYLAWEAQLIPAFSPYGNELSFGHPEEPTFEYAGCQLVGSIDRVDVDSFGRAVVLDYKGSVGDKYMFRAKDAEEFALPQKVQALIYAQAVRRVFGLTPVAAIYVSYGAKRGLAGLYDQTALSSYTDLLRINASRCGTSTFYDDLDRVEEAIFQRVQLLKAGLIEPAPRDADVCKYCPVLLCQLPEQPASIDIRGLKGGE